MIHPFPSIQFSGPSLIQLSIGSTPRRPKPPADSPLGLSFNSTLRLSSCSRARVAPFSAMDFASTTPGHPAEPDTRSDAKRCGCERVRGGPNVGLGWEANVKAVWKVQRCASLNPSTRRSWSSAGRKLFLGWYPMLLPCLRPMR